MRRNLRKVNRELNHSGKKSTTTTSAVPSRSLSTSISVNLPNQNIPASIRKTLNETTSTVTKVENITPIIIPSSIVRKPSDSIIMSSSSNSSVIMSNNVTASGKKKRKAANLSELRRYFKAAEEAAAEVLAEEMGTDGGDQVPSIYLYLSLCEFIL